MYHIILCCLYSYNTIYGVTYMCMYTVHLTYMYTYKYICKESSAKK